MIELFEHNQKAYESVLEHLEESGKAAIIHPTGTGKSFIAFKLAEDHPQASFVWLSPSENIWHTQLNNIKKISGFVPENIIFRTYARLMNESEEELSVLNPDYIILDEFHRAGASEWGRGVQTLIGLFPETKLLGLSATNIRYLDHQRDMADELFDNCIADQMSLAEAVSNGILPAPKYVVSFYAYSLEEEKYRSRMKRVSVPVRRKAEDILERLRHAIENAEGLEEIFPKHMENPHRKYIVFCANYDHMLEMMEKSKHWFKNVDPDPHFYSVWAESPSAQKDYQAFCDDQSEHLKLLFCIDMFNEGIHVENISGVILFRPTISPIIYKQQIGRALSAMKGKDGQEPIIFDIVNNFENLYTISSLQDEVNSLVTFRANEYGTDISDKVSSFRIIDEVRECRRLFSQLEDTLGLSWDMMFLQAKDYYEANGHLNVPKNYRTEDGVPLGIWIMTQRRIRNGTTAGLLTSSRIQRLDSIGMDWRNRSENAWERGYLHAKEYRAQNGDLEVPARYISPDGFRLGSWITSIRTKYSNLSENDTNSQAANHYKKLTELGMIWNRADYTFRKGYQAAEKYKTENGHLNPPRSYVTEDGFKLGEWLESQRKRRKAADSNDSTATEEFARLDALGMVWQTATDQLWENSYKKAEEYFRTHGNLDLPTHYMAGKTNLWKWINRQQAAYKNNKLDAEKIHLLESIGIQWDTRNKGWNYNYNIARTYFESHGDLEVPPEYVSPEGVWLARWLYRQRSSRKEGLLTESQIQALECLHMRWGDKAAEHWDEMYDSLISWIPNGKGLASVPRTACTADGTNLYRWARRQETKRRQGKLTPVQQQKWDSLYNRTASA